MKSIRHLILLAASLSLFTSAAPLSAADSTTRKSKSTTAETDKARTPSSAKVDLNTADAETLESLPGVGPQTARAIIAARPFKTVDDLERVSGIGPAKMADLRDQVTVSSKAATTKKSDGRKSTPSTARTESRPSTFPPSASTTPTTTPPRSSRTAEERPLEPTGRVDTGRSGDVERRTTSASTVGRVNLNTATREELEALPEIGPVKAQAIIDARPFTSIEDVMRVKGIKEGTFEAIKDRISVR